MPKGSPGKPHPPDCAHCAAVKNSNKASLKIAPNGYPLCKCHGEPMVWARMDRLKSGGTWKCSVVVRGYSRKVRLKKFGIDEAKYVQMLNEQNGLCAICKGPPDTRWKKLAVDHSHKTGEVRGLLCMTCNTMLGRLEKRWDETMRYLKK